MDKSEQILEKLSRIIDPDLHKDIVSLGFIKDLKITDESNVFFSIELTTPACPVKEKFRAAAIAAVKELDWVETVDVNMTARERNRGPKVPDGMKQVRTIIGVSSCKGGVGKSTIATNLAFALQAKGAAVGIFDADVYGPSLPTMVDAGKIDGLFYTDAGLLRPIVHETGMKLMSFAYASKDSAAIMRGPMVSQVVQQLLVGCDWGELDYLVIDMPPGTGDIQLTITQTVSLDAAVIITTPQKISFIDVVKGIEMFDKLEVPVVAVVENMSYFICDGCDKKHHIFGSGSCEKLVERFGIQNSYEIPIIHDIAIHGDGGLPITAAHPQSLAAEAYFAVADGVIREASRVSLEKMHPIVESVDGVVVVTLGDQTQSWKPAALRRSCRCAHCVNEFTGEKVLKDADISEDLVAESISSMGNYAARIQWSDGHSSIMPYKMMLGSQ